MIQAAHDLKPLDEITICRGKGNTNTWFKLSGAVVSVSGFSGRCPKYFQVEVLTPVDPAVIRVQRSGSVVQADEDYYFDIESRSDSEDEELDDEILDLSYHPENRKKISPESELARLYCM
eukprot:gene6881-4911_t